MSLDSNMATDSRQPQKGKMGRGKRVLLWVAGSVLVVLLIVGAIVAVLLQRAEPMMRAALINTLQKRFHSRVELDDMRVSIVDGFRVEGRGLRIWLPAGLQTDTATAVSGNPANSIPTVKPSAANPQAKPAQANSTSSDAATLTDGWMGAEGRKAEPWIMVSKFNFHASWRILPGKPIVISIIHVEGVRVLLPPKADRPAMGGSSDHADDASTQGSQSQSYLRLPQIEVRRVECKDALLVIERKREPGKPEKIPLDFQFKKVTVVPDGRGGPMAYTVEMVNAKPIGDIVSSGHAGPWVSHDPGALPIQGEYKFDRADLSTIKGIAGMLSSTGRYTGTLRQIAADGETRTPDFRLQRVDKVAGVPLNTRFHAIVDGTNGDTYLQAVDAMLGHTHIFAKGKVVRAEDATGQKHGHDITLQVNMDRGRIEDILNISANQETPFMTGNLSLQTHFHLPPGPEPVMDKLQLDGAFHLSQTRFSNDKMQDRIDELSLRGQGKPKEAKAVGKTGPTDIESDVEGHFKLGGGTLDLPDLDYHVPGAEITARGQYGMKEGALNFVGDAKLDASISQIVGGWKGLLLKPADRFLSKNGAGTDVPIHVNGTRKDPKFGVDFDRLGKNDKEPQQEQPEKPR
jgi:hypothetical protein